MASHYIREFGPGEGFLGKAAGYQCEQSLSVDDNFLDWRIFVEHTLSMEINLLIMAPDKKG